MASSARVGSPNDNLLPFPGIYIPQSIDLVAERRESNETEFDRQIAELGLADQSLTQLASAKSDQHRALRMWARLNYKKRYIPEMLLVAWGIYAAEEIML